MADEAIKNELLKNAPLKEVIFELHWELEFVPEQNILIDNGFEEAIINFTNACQQDFKIVEIVKPVSIPITAFIHKITHRFFRQKGQYPLYQIGPGVFTANDNNKNYRWQDFKQLITNGIHCLQNSYSKPLVPSKIELRYVDAVSVSALGKSDKFSFLKKHLNVNAEGYAFVDGELSDINFTKRFSITDDAYLNMMIATGTDLKTKDESIVWHTFVNNKKALTWDEIIPWLDKAHDVSSTTFKKMLSNELYQYFN